MKYVLLIFCASAAFCGGTTILTEDVDPGCQDLAVTDWGAVIFVNGEGDLAILNPDYTGNPTGMMIDWGYQLEEWGELHRVFDLCGSSDGRMICFVQTVGIPEEYYRDEDFNIPYPQIVALCRSDGMDPKLLGLSFEVGSGPHFTFTQDGGHVYGGPWLECDPDPESFIGYFSGDDSFRETPWLMVDTETGARSGDPAVISDGFRENPYSDFVAAGWYPPNTIVDITTQRVMQRDTSPDGPAIIDEWVLPYGGLARNSDGDQMLRFVDGTCMINPGNDIDVYCRLSDGRFLFTRDGGENLLLGSIELPGFSSPDAVPVPWLAGLYPETVVHELPDDRGIVFVDGGALTLAQLP